MSWNWPCCCCTSLVKYVMYRKRMYVVEMRWGIVGLKGCLQRVMAAEKAIMNLMGGQSVPTCVPAFLKVDWSNSVRLVSPLHLSWWWWPDRPTRPPWDETEAAYFPFSPKTTGRKWKRVLHFLLYILYHLFWLSAHPSLPLLSSSLPLPLTYVYKHTL